jgi:hypothetical protein
MTPSAITTVETRWFFPVQPPARPAVFAAGPAAETRTDLYAPPHPGCGIKFREGNFEVKLKVQDLGAFELGGPIGEVQSWRKWIHEGDPGLAPERDNLEANGWIPVTKTRSLLAFVVDRGEVHSVQDWPTDGCQFEWTEVKAFGRTWLTIGLESYGNEDRLLDNLLATGRRIMPELQPDLSLRPETSYCYAEWLTRLKA